MYLMHRSEQQGQDFLGWCGSEAAVRCRHYNPISTDEEAESEFSPIDTCIMSTTQPESC